MIFKFDCNDTQNWVVLGRTVHICEHMLIYERDKKGGLEGSDKA